MPLVHGQRLGMVEDVARIPAALDGDQIARSLPVVGEEVKPEGVINVAIRMGTQGNIRLVIIATVYHAIGIPGGIRCASIGGVNIAIHAIDPGEMRFLLAAVGRASTFAGG